MLLMVHADGCGELLDEHGGCPRCHFHPDMQSTEFKNVTEEEFKRISATRHSFLGRYREPVRVVEFTKLTPRSTDRPDGK